MPTGSSTEAPDPRLAAARAVASEQRGWSLSYTRGYSVSAAPPGPRDWLLAHLPFQAPPHVETSDSTIDVLSRGPIPAVRVTFNRLRLARLTEWDLSSPSLVVAHDSVWKGERLELVSREEIEFMGNDNGSIIEVRKSHRPVSLVSRLGFGVFPESGATARREEAAIFSAMEAELHESRP